MGHKKQLEAEFENLCAAELAQKEEFAEVKQLHQAQLSEIITRKMEIAAELELLDGFGQ